MRSRITVAVYRLRVGQFGFKPLGQFQFKRVGQFEFKRLGQLAFKRAISPKISKTPLWDRKAKTITIGR